MNIIKKYLPEIGAVLVTVGLIIWGTIQTLRLQSSMNDTVRVTLAFEQYKVDQQAKMQQEQQRRIEAIEEVKNEANRHIQRIQIGADGARASVGILQQQLAHLRASNNTAAAAECKTENERVTVLTIVSDECAEKYSEVARIAEESRARGLACEAAYDALRK